MLVLLAFLAAAAPATEPISGRYAVAVGAPEGPSAQTGVLLLSVRNGKVLAAVGPSDQQLRPVAGALLEGQGIRLTIGSNAMEWHLRFDDGMPAGEERRGATVRTLKLKRIGALTMADRVRLLPLLSYEDAQTRSPLIIELREAVESGEPRTVDVFWDRVEREGTPIVEPFDGETVLATFLWRGTDKTRSVLLERGRFTFQQPVTANLFSHIEGTDVWFKTVRLPRAARFTYRLSENDPAAVLPPGSWPRTAVLDPFNARRTINNRSLAELPGAPDQRWISVRPGTPSVALLRHRLKSSILGNERDLLVYTPPAYNPAGRPYPTIYLFDAEDPGGPVFETTTIENLLRDGAIPPAIVVRIGNPSAAERSRELSCNPSFGQFLAEEVIPFVRQRYHASDRPIDTLVGGQSLGGLAAACAALRYPEYFGLVLVQSGSFWWEPTGAPGAEPNWVAAEFLKRPRLPLRFYLEAGRFEVDLTGRGGNILETTRHLRDVLRAKGYHVQHHEFVGDHEFVNWRGTLADGLIALLGRRADTR
jgi:enterochelin esterase-like enzyme